MKRLFLFCLTTVFVIHFSRSAPAQGNPEAAKLARQGAQAAKDSDWDKAVDLFRQATELDRKNASNLSAVLQQRAVAYTSQQKFPEAIADFGEALKINPRDAQIYERRAYVEMKTNDLDKALADYTEAIKYKPNEIRYYQVRSYIFEVKGDLKGSMADTERILKADKRNAEALSRKERLEKIQAMNAPQPPPPKKP